MLLVIAIFKFGVAFNNYLTLTDAVRSGARQLAIERGQGQPCQDTISSITTSAGGLNLANLNVTVEPDATPPVTQKYLWTQATGGTGPCNALTSGHPASVTATYGCDASIFGIDFAPHCTLSASATERTE